MNDDTYTATCDRVGVECFLQVLFSDFLFYDNIIDCGYLVAFEHNYAEAKGSNLFGGLLHRCTVSPYAVVTNSCDGISYFKTISNSTLNHPEISSKALAVCQCSMDHPECALRQLSVSQKG